jgi:demethylmenaquinone methyltransferase/2-methoxy-6-polyprenyl-1,4-benzoquinol methylase
MKQNPEKEWFGDRQVEPEEKTKLVHGVFDSVAARYDLMNDLMSGGVHRRWKRRFIRRIRPRNGLKYLDVAGGTGDIAFKIKKAAPNAEITLCDLTEEMLLVGRDRAVDKGYLNDFEWVTGNAEKLPFEDESFDVYTISFGLRNVTRIDSALKEAHRVLKPGGKFYCLEFSHVEDELIKKFYDLYSYNVIPKIGKIVASDEDSYQYLVESIRKFPDQEALCERIKKSGFHHAEYINMTFGVVAIHSAWKI